MQHFLFGLSVYVWAHTAWAQADTTVQQAQTCHGALSALLTVPNLPSQELVALKSAQAVMARLAQADDAALAQATRDVQIQKTQARASFTQTVVLCGAWADGFLAQGAEYRYVPVFPKIVAPTVRSRYEGLAAQVP